MKRLLAFALALTLAACDTSPLPERSNPADPGWPVGITETDPPRDLRLADERADFLPFSWVAPELDLPVVVARVSARTVSGLPSAWTNPTAVRTVPAGRTAFRDTTLVAPAAACYRVSVLDLDMPFTAPTNTVCVASSVERRVLTALGNAISTPLVVSLDGATVFAAGAGVFAWDVATDAGRGRFAAGSRLAGLTTTGGAVLTGTSGATVRVWNVSPASVLSEATLTPPQSCSAFPTTFVASRDGSTLAGSCSGTTTVWDVATGARRQTVDRGGLADVSPDGRHLLFASTELRVVSGATGETVWAGAVPGLRRARFAGQHVVAYSSSLVASYDAATGARVASRPAPASASLLTPSRDGQRLIVHTVSPFSPTLPSYAVVDAATLDIVRLVREPFSFDSAALDGDRVFGVERGGPVPATVEWMDVSTPWQVVATPAGLE